MIPLVRSKSGSQGQGISSELVHLNSLLQDYGKYQMVASSKPQNNATQGYPTNCESATELTSNAQKSEVCPKNPILASEMQSVDPSASINSAIGDHHIPLARACDQPKRKRTRPSKKKKSSYQLPVNIGQIFSDPPIGPEYVGATNYKEIAAKNLIESELEWTFLKGQFTLVAFSLTCAQSLTVGISKEMIQSALSSIDAVVGSVEFIEKSTPTALTGRVYASTESVAKRIEGTLKSVLKRIPGVHSVFSLHVGIGLDPALQFRYLSATRQKALDIIEKSNQRVSQQFATRLKSVLEEDEFATDKLIEFSDSTKVFQRECSEGKMRLNDLTLNDYNKVYNIQFIQNRIRQSEKQALLGLPIYSHKEVIINQVRDNQVSVFVAETGSGKSTQIVQYLQTSGLFDGKIACTQPRRLAARSLAEYVAQQMDCRPGTLVASLISGKPVASDTKIVYMTDFQLLQLCTNDPQLNEYDCVVVDEAHERNLHTDLIIGLLKRALEVRPKLRVLITSATINPSLFLSFFENFSTAHDTIPGRVYKVDVHYSKDKMDKTDRYYERAVNKVVELCEDPKVPHGNILVFLTTPRETEIASDMCSKKLKSLPKATSYSVFPLHGQLQPEDQKLAMAEVKDKCTRKIIFATNCAETSLTIPGVVVVVDSGLSKQNAFDPVKNMDTLVVGEISQNSADQRKGRAGRTQNGCCYRLFTEAEYKAMQESTTPEIQRIDLAGVALRILEFGLDPLNFYYLSPPSKEGLEKALTTLTLIGAVCDGRLTDLGRQIAKIPTEPRLAKMIILCCKRNFAMEGIVVASIISLSGQVFFRGKTDSERQEATKTKEFYATDEGDLFTSMQVFKDWQSHSQEKRAKWSVKNCVNNKSMRAVEEMVADVQRALKHDLKWKISGQFLEASNASAIIQECIYTVYSDHLCVYSGNPRIGFVQVQSGHRMLVHPSSVFSNGVNFSMAVYSKLLKTEQTYLLNITPVLPQWIRNFASLQPQKIFNTIFRLMPVSHEVLKRLLGRGRTACKQLEEKVRTEIKPNLFEIHCNFDSYSVDIVCEPAALLDSAKELVENGIKDILSGFSKDLYLSQDQTQLPCTIRLAPGFLISQLHFSGESNLVKVLFRQPDTVVTKSVLEAVTAKYSNSDFGQIEIQSQGQDLFLKTESPVSAQRLIEKINKSETELTAQTRYARDPSQPDNQRCDLNELKLKLTFPRRNPIGRMTVENLNAPNDAGSVNAVIKSLPLTSLWSSPVHINRKDSANLMIFDVPLWLDENDVKTTLKKQLEHYGISVDPTVRRLRESPDKAVSKQEARDRVIRILTVIFDQAFINREEDYQIAIRDPPNPGYYDWNVTICFRFDEDYVRFVKKFELRKAPEKRHGLGEYHGYMHVDKRNRRALVEGRQEAFKRLDFANTTFALLFPPLLISSEIYSASKSTVEEFVNHIQHQHSLFPTDIQLMLQRNPIEVKVDNEFMQRQRGMEVKKTRIDVETNDLTSWSFAYQHLRKCLKPHELGCSRSDQLKSLLLKSSETAVRKLLPESAHVIFDVRRESISIYGSESVKNRCLIIINEYLCSREAICIREIPLSGANRAKGLIRCLLKVYGRDMSGLLTAHPGVTTAELDIVTRKLILSGNETVASAVEDVERLAADALMAAQTAAAAARMFVKVPGTVELECPVCLSHVGDAGEAATAAAGRESCTLCGHIYCQECLQLQVNAATDVPLLCAAERCGQPLHIENDILGRRATDSAEHEQLHRRLLSLAIKRHVAEPRNCLQFCPTPDCLGLLRDFKTIGIREAKCAVCRNTFCLDCRDFHHLGLSCETAKEIKENPDYGLQSWLQADKRNRKRCPRCPAIIEKNSGCNHMTCGNCGCHFCWPCRMAFNTGEEVYNHQPLCNGGP